MPIPYNEYALLLQEVLAEKDQHLTVPSDLNHHVLNSGYFKSTLLLHVIAEKISSSFDSCQRMDWLNAALTLNQSASNRLPQALSCSLFKDYRDELKQTRAVFEKPYSSVSAVFTAQKQHSP